MARQRDYSPEFWELLVRTAEAGIEEEEQKEESTSIAPLGFTVSIIFGLTILSRLLTKISEVISR